MDIEHGKKPSANASEPCTVQQVKHKFTVLHPTLLRASALSASTVAAVVMGLNKQSYTAVVAIVGTKPLKQTFTAQFKDTSAFVYFVIANSIASLYNLVVVLVVRRLVQGRVQRLVLLVHMTDMVIMVLLATGAATAASMAELGKNGNLHAHWNPLCNKFCTKFLLRPWRRVDRVLVRWRRAHAGHKPALRRSQLSPWRRRRRRPMSSPHLRQPKSTVLMSCHVKWQSANPVHVGAAVIFAEDGMKLYHLAWPEMGRHIKPSWLWGILIG